MNILTISTRFYPDESGIAKQVYLISKYLSKKNKIINVTCNPKSSLFYKRVVNDNFKIYYLPLKPPGINARFLKLVKFFFQFYVLAMIKSVSIIRKEKIDIIHSHSPAPSGFIAFSLKKFFRIPYFYTIHGIEKILKIIHLLDFKFTVKYSDETLVVSKQIEIHLRENFGLDGLRWFSNGIDINSYYHAKNEKEKDKFIKKLNLNSILKMEDFIISYIGYMIFWQKVKGMIDFLVAFKKFIEKILDKERRKHIKLIFIGKGKYSETLLRKVEELKLKNNVIYCGYRDDIHTILAISDLLALVSYIEGSPLVILEAMASKVPCLGSSVGDIPFMINNSGYLVKPGESKEIIKNLKDFYNMSDVERKAMSLSAYHRVKDNFSIKIIGKRLVNLYKETLRNRA
ncbi:MAG: glycosyltransferase [Candidatus Lokiarchaeota archaeon]|nr:glycosyltransferase [Candidatus Lokiarchaeota archaeon]